jgi:hypothetical protein
MTDQRWTNPIASFRTVAEDPALADAIQRLVERNWPRFVVEGHDAPGFPPADWMGIYRRWPHLQLGAFDAAGELVAAADACALAWDGDPDDLPDGGWAWALSTAQDDLAAGRAPNTLCGLGITVDAELQGVRLSPAMVESLRDLARANGLRRVIAPVRPTWKARYPLTPLEEYVRWLREDQLPYDPWLRTHVRIGGRVGSVCSRSMAMAGSVAEWEAWTGLQFPHSGDYPIPGGLCPVSIDLEQDRGLYVEPNVWVVHDIG